MDDEKIDKIEEKIEKLQADYMTLKYVIEKESFVEQLIKIFINNISLQLPEIIEQMKGINITFEKKGE